MIVTPENLRYTKDHEWARLDGDVVTVGITDFAQEQLSDVVYVELPPVGKTLGQHDGFGVIEAVKTVADLYAPVAGEIVAVNDALAGQPQLVNESPYDKGWMVKIRVKDPKEMDQLLDAKTYAAHVEEATK
jgi:glycine cleavage system H protein